MTLNTMRKGLLLSFSMLTLVSAFQMPAQAQVPADLGAALVAGLKATPGCLGVETAQTSSGKQVIFAWFENKQAVLAWYYSDVHQRAMHQFVPGERPPHVPLAQIADDGQPIMAVASLTISRAPAATGVSLPVSQRAIELYRPAPGGIAVGGRFAPPSLVVPGLVDVPPGSADRQ